MSAHKIKKLLNQYNNLNDEYDFYEFQIYSDDITKSKRNVYEQEMHGLEYEMWNIGKKIVELKPSKYMLNKHVELQDILEEYTVK